MRLNPLRADRILSLKRRGLLNKFEKQARLFERNPQHPSLHTERLQPLSLRLYLFRIDLKYRVIFLLKTPGETEIVDINDHYQ
ncbi:MAG: hypothetical protein UV63_C0035G0015 [Microgenomates group bacterium GW2011_GWC1_43_11]|uniref:Plasmid stabilization system n=2 Tax=Candidatus Gottesmaniibacteriota TaxID=1752720 RepID=A0A0G1LGR0_9BACT|nr:MAG: hypothetical protein UV63_C0035G0015 [Microgenomates group bacterium GW2011_GWC1_43_11]KKT35110.1 MAG: hypothetical protein UW22_C0059G0008 [Candidatus Gottesmanbacteria bacterium GW2011_GWB1_44_11c]KKT59094.1 MAG: hypothetical protein UW52_C0049G0012 [Candidatus Gottesmanbacteria bacterium GW2011_GWA1_44_24b]HCM82106.1 hypothetical protein [Patescibacteria group bacterium]